MKQRKSIFSIRGVLKIGEPVVPRMSAENVLRTEEFRMESRQFKSANQVADKIIECLSDCFEQPRSIDGDGVASSQFMLLTKHDYREATGIIAANANITVINGLVMVAVTVS